MEMKIQIALGGTILFVSLLLFLIVVAGTWWAGAPADTVDDSIPPPLSGAEHTPKILDNIKLWLGIAVVLVILAYTLPLADMLADGIFQPGVPPSPM
jgi:cytochrome c oxidase subunit 1